jgi:hypothetical protein
MFMIKGNIHTTHRNVPRIILLAFFIILSTTRCYAAHWSRWYTLQDNQSSLSRTYAYFIERGGQWLRTAYSKLNVRMISVINWEWCKLKLSWINLKYYLGIHPGRTEYNHEKPDYWTEISILNRPNVKHLDFLHTTSGLTFMTMRTPLCLSYAVDGRSVPGQKQS